MLDFSSRSLVAVTFLITISLIVSPVEINLYEKILSRAISPFFAASLSFFSMLSKTRSTRNCWKGGVFMLNVSFSAIITRIESWLKYRLAKSVPVAALSGTTLLSSVAGGKDDVSEGFGSVISAFLNPSSSRVLFTYSSKIFRLFRSVSVSAIFFSSCVLNLARFSIFSFSFWRRG